jgi:cystathionine beta-lyase/cystathionine gamma-synthase
MSTSATPKPGASLTVVNSTGKKVTMVADTVSGLAATFLAMFGLKPIGDAVTLADQLFDAAMAGWENGQTVVITEETITTLFVNLQLADPTDVPVVESPVKAPDLTGDAGSPVVPPAPKP